jgi:hypothetical protein
VPADIGDDGDECSQFQDTIAPGQLSQNEFGQEAKLEGPKIALCTPIMKMEASPIGRFSAESRELRAADRDFEA